MSNKIQRGLALLSPSKKEECIKNIISFFNDERDEEIGIIAAEDVLDCVLQEAAAEIYNKGVHDAKELLKKHFEDLQVDLDVLQIDKI